MALTLIYQKGPQPVFKVVEAIFSILSECMMFRPRVRVRYLSSSLDYRLVSTVRIMPSETLEAGPLRQRTGFFTTPPWIRNHPLQQTIDPIGIAMLTCSLSTRNTTPIDLEPQRERFDSVGTRHPCLFLLSLLEEQFDIQTTIAQPRTAYQAIYSIH